jgi:hypothetical protein
MKERGIYPGQHVTTSEDELLGGYKGVSIDLAPGLRVVNGDVVTLRLTFTETESGITVSEALVLSVEHMPESEP